MNLDTLNYINLHVSLLWVANQYRQVLRNGAPIKKDVRYSVQVKVAILPLGDEFKQLEMLFMISWFKYIMVSHFKGQVKNTQPNGEKEETEKERVADKKKAEKSELLQGKVEIGKKI